MSSATTTLFVCTSCRRRIGEGDAPEAFDRPGAGLAADLTARIADNPHIEVVAVDCLAVCKRPCTVAVTGPGKWTYLVGDLDPTAHVDEIESAVRAFAATTNGIVPWKERPQTFRKGVVARVPPLGYVIPEAVLKAAE